MKPLTIGQICHGRMGGSSRMACRLANALARRGHRVHLFSREPVPWPTGARVTRHICSPVSADPEAPLHVSWSAGDREAFERMLGTQMATERFDVLHYHYARPFAQILGAVAPRPFVIGTLHGTDLTRCADPATLARELAATDALTTVSEYLRQRAVELGVPSPRVVPNFVEDDWIAARRSGPPTIVHVSTFRAVKDVGLLARLFAAVRQRTAARLVLVGNGPQLPGLRAMLDPAAVRCVGATAHPEDHFTEGAVLLSTSVEESFGLVLLEAMAAGVPVVARAVGGVPELVEDGVSGLLFDADDFALTVNRIVNLLGSPERLVALREGGLARARAWRESRVIGAYEALYRSLIEVPGA